MIMRNTDILETQWIQRSFDGCWEKVVKVMDRENAYSFRNESGVGVTLIPEKWMTVAVVPFLMEEV